MCAFCYDKQPLKIPNKLLLIENIGTTEFSILWKTSLKLKMSRFHIKYTMLWQNKNKLQQKHWKTWRLTNFWRNAAFLNPLKKSENQFLFYVFMRWRNTSFCWNGLRRMKIIWSEYFLSQDFIRFRPVFSSYTPDNRKTKGFLIFSWI